MNAEYSVIHFKVYNYDTKRIQTLQSKIIKMNKTLKVLVACEESQTVCKEFRELGHDAYSNDIIECSGGHPDWHLQMDALDAIKLKDWDLVIAHPPCTRLANSGVRWLAERNLWGDMRKAAAFFNHISFACRVRNIPFCIENPIPHKYAIELISHYTQLIQPWMFGHGETKATCLWLNNLPKLTPTQIVSGREQRIWNIGPGKDRSKKRSKTYSGIAKAMAEQWSNYLLYEK